MKTIWKFQLDTTDRQSLLLPEGAEILCVQSQFEVPTIWALVDPEANKEERFFDTFGTGHPVHEDMGVSRTYIGTYQQAGGSLVFHLFERL